MGLYPVGKAQKMVLDALGVQIETHQGAKDFFKRVGIVVSSVRQGRTSVPSIRRLPESGSAFNDWGEGETWENDYEDIDFSKIKQWMKE